VIAQGSYPASAADGGIIVRNAGVINAVGTPESVVSFVSDAQTYHDDYEFAIKIEGSASSMCKINYCHILCAEKGIWIRNSRLDNPLMDNDIEWCYDGIYQEGPELTDVLNNEIIDCYDEGIEIYMADANGNATSETRIAMEHNTIVGSFYYGEGQNYGITVHGVADSNEVGTVFMADNLIAGSYYYAIVQADGWMLGADRYNHGYYANYAIENPGNPFNDIAPQILTQDPFVNGYTQYPFFLKQDCALIDAGSKYIDETTLIGKATTVDGVPDSNITDIGFHYINWQFSNAGGTILSADLNNDYKVDFGDIMILADYWLYDYQENYEIWSWDWDDSGVVDYNDLAVIKDNWLTYFDFYGYANFAQHWLREVDEKLFNDRPDLNNDGFVNLADFAILANQWTNEVNSPHPPIAVTISGDPCNLSGDIEIGVGGYGTTTEHVFVLMDGKYIGELEYFDSNTPLLLETDNYRNGGHSIKVVAIDANGLVTVSATLEVDFSNAFYSIIAPEYFYPTADYNVWGFHNSSSSFEAKLTNHSNQIIWSNTYSGQCVNIVIPGAAFGNAQLCELSIIETDSSMMVTASASGATGSSGVTSKDVSRKFNMVDCPAGVRMVIILPNKDVFKRRKPAILECANACDNRNVPWVSLYYRDVTEDNLRFLYNKSSVKYIYWCGHANSHVGRNERLGIPGVQRTHTMCWRYEPSWWHFNWQEIGVFSWTRQTRDFPPLPDNWDNKGFDLWTLPMHDQWNKKIIFVDGCLSAERSDMAEAYGVFSLQGYGSLDQIYIGWREEVLVSTGIIENIVGNTTEGVRMFWERMGYGDSVEEALEHTSTHGGIGMRTAMWGINGMPDFGDVDGDDNIFVWGLGFTNLNQIELEL